MNEIIIVLGTPRSGSTWLGNVLKAHPQIVVRKDDTAVLYLSYPLRTLNPFGEDYTQNPSVLSDSLDQLRARFVLNHYLPNQYLSKKLVFSTTIFPLFINTEKLKRF